MNLRIKQSSYGYNSPYSYQMVSSLEVQNRDDFFDILVYPPPQIGIEMSLHIYQDYSSS